MAYRNICTVTPDIIQVNSPAEISSACGAPQFVLPSRRSEGSRERKCFERLDATAYLTAWSDGMRKVNQSQ